MFPSWVQTLDAMIEAGRPVRVSCDTCQQSKALDLETLREKVGGSYSLVNRRCRCRLTPGCRGWNRFFYINGVYRPLWDYQTADRWM